ncbi:YIP1 family protein [Candidatus Woesearchaeota archaeon]|nr:YIP1 family protein [Candidatus Woesearchaeota archaeon]
MVSKELLNYLNKEEHEGYTPAQLMQTCVEAGWDADEIEEALKEISNPNKIDEKKIAKESEPGIWPKVAMALKTPADLFEVTRKESFIDVLKYNLVISLIPSVVLATIMFLIVQFAGSLIGSFIESFTGSSIVPFALGISLAFGGVVYAYIIISLIVSAGIVHLIAKLLKGAGRFTDTYQAIVYGMTPALLLIILTLIPGLGLITIIWTFIITMLGLEIGHRMSRAKAISTLLLPGLIILLASGAVIILSLPFLMLASESLDQSIASQSPLTFEFHETSGCINGTMTLTVRNTGKQVITPVDWRTTRVDNESFEVLPVDVPPGETVMIYQSEKKYEPGLHQINVNTEDTYKKFWENC